MEAVLAHLQAFDKPLAVRAQLLALRQADALCVPRAIEHRGPRKDWIWLD
jgi:hypothetical protein